MLTRHTIHEDNNSHDAGNRDEGWGQGRSRKFEGGSSGKGRGSNHLLLQNGTTPDLTLSCGGGGQLCSYMYTKGALVNTNFK